MPRRSHCLANFFTPLAALAALWLTLGSPASSSARAVTSDDYIFADSFESRDCSLPLTCSAPLFGKSCIAGQLTDVATTQPLHAAFNVGLTCGQGALGGPCDLSLGAHDALQYAANPAADPPLASGGTVVDGCGRFHFSDLAAPTSGYVAIVADDAPGNDGHTPAATLRGLGANQQVAGVNAVVAQSNTLTSWSLLGQTDLSNGAVLLSYSTGGTPTAGVTVSHGGSVGAIRYFSDADSQRITVNSSATSTGANGSALVANAPFQTYSGSGGESNGCAWTTVNMVTIQGVIVFAELACVF
jgi:hypothetical protein